MKLSPAAEKELLELACSEAFSKDMEILNRRLQPLVVSQDSSIADSYVSFVTLFNEFINHKPKPFRPMPDRDFRL